MLAMNKKTKLRLGTLLVATTVGLTACQQEPEAAPVEDPARVETTVDPVATPVESTDTATDTTKIVTVEETVVELSPEEQKAAMADQTVAQVDSPASTIINYSCTPALAVSADYNDMLGNVKLTVNGNEQTLLNTNTGQNPEVFKSADDMNGNEEGGTQWRVAHSERETGILRMSDGEQPIQTYECKSK